jgi:peptide subunit release factor 1 (eRF1)
LLDRPGFWRGLSDGLAAFISADASEFYRLPLPFEEVAILEDRFHLKPLFPLIAANKRFYLLALSKNDVRLYQGTHQAISEVEAAEIPTDIVTAIQQYEEPPEQGLQMHSQGKAGTDGRADQMRHGHGSSEDQSREPKNQVKRFFRRIDESVSDYIGGQDAPLVLAGVSEYLPLYKSVNSYPHLVEDEIVAGNPERLSMDELHEEAWDVVESVLQSLQQEELDRFEDLHYQDGDLASDDFHEIIPACAYSRVETLFVPMGQYRWGRFDPDTNTVEVHESQEPGDGDLLNYAALQSYLSGATVHVLPPEDMPGGRSIAAIFRYKADVKATETG